MTLLLNDARMRRAFAWLERERSGTLGLLSENLGFPSKVISHGFSVNTSELLPASIGV